MDVCTIVSKNYVAYARVLARSLAEHQPEARLSVLVLDEFDGYIDAESEPFELVRPGDIGCDEFNTMALRYDVVELSTAVKPWLLRHLLARGAETITYLDSDIQVFGPLARLERLGVEHGLVLIPHNTVPIPSDGEHPTQVDVLVTGIFNLGYVTFAAGPQADQLLDWWAERLRRECRLDPSHGYFLDQRWMDLVPGLVPRYAVVRDPEFNVAYWNLHARDLAHDGERYTVDQRPLAFFHFSGFDPDAPEILSRDQTRIRTSDWPALARICREYAAALQENGYATTHQWPYGQGFLPDGTQLTAPLRRLYADADARGEFQSAPGSEHAGEGFLRWIRADDEGAPYGMTRLLTSLYRSRSDLQTAFPDVAGDDRLAYLAWAHETGLPELGLPPELARPSDVPIEAAAPAAASAPPDRAQSIARLAQRELEITQALASARIAFETERIAREDAERHAYALVGTKTFRYTAALRRSYSRLLRARPKSTTETPVVLVVFNRPETTARVFAEIAQARPRRLLIAADGPRPDRPGEAEKCAAVRAIVEGVGWECEVSHHYSDVNLGLARRFATGLSWAFEQVDEAIILEDDCLPHPSFFGFCDELLEKYRYDERVMTICGDNYLFGRKRFPHSYFFHYIPGWYGWATWRRAFQHYDFGMSRWPELRKTTFLEQHLQDADAVEYWRKMFDLTCSGAIGTWDSQWVLTVFEQHGLAATASVNLVSNIGFGPHAVHMKSPDHPVANMPVEEMTFPLQHPRVVIPDRDADRLVIENVYLADVLAWRQRGDG